MVGRRWRAAVVTVAVATGACGAETSTSAGCGDGAVVEGRPLRVVTTVSPLTDIVAQITAGTPTEIVGIVPEGVDSHTYEPAPSDVAAIADADVVFVNGLGLESAVGDLTRANARPGAELCELGTTVLAPDDYLFDDSFPERAGDPNPHLWTNPPMVAAYIALVRDVLVARDPAHRADYEANAQRFSSQVADLDAAMRVATATVPAPRRVLLTYHDAYAYTAREYGWRLLGAIQPASFDEPTPREVAALVEQVRATGVGVVFGSEVFPSPVLEQIAAETGARYDTDLRDDDLPGRPGDQEHSWLALMRDNLAAIIDGSGGDPSALLAVDVTSAARGVATFPQS